MEHHVDQALEAGIDQGLKTFRGELRISTWIYRIATHTALDRLRSPYAREGQEKKASLKRMPWMKG